MRCPKKGSVFAILLWVAVILLGANAAVASPPPALEIAFLVPASVNIGATFTITVSVTNTLSKAVTFNRVAAGYALADMKVKGPYEVSTATYTLLPGASTSFSFSFRIFYGSGSIVPVAVFLAEGSYQYNSIYGGGVVGVKVN